MGFAISWLAAQGLSADACCEALALSRTGNLTNEPRAIGGRELETGWYLIWFEDFSGATNRTESICALSRRGDVVTCCIEEHVMFSRTSLFRAGREIWFVEHQGHETVHNLTSQGDPPDCFAKIRKELESEQAREDAGSAEIDYIFEIPPTVARHLTGFKHDEPEDEELSLFEELSIARL